MFMLLIELAIVGAMLAGMWKVFEKMGRQGWEGIVPIYNIYVLLQVLRRPVIWLVFCLIPIVNIAAIVILCLDVAKGFGKTTGYGVGLALLGFVFWPMLGFGQDSWKGATELTPVPF
ncbi:MAG TPA: DUF5684 domain-containing protein, partial [Tepidisphaeraceae bacterium]